MKNDKKAMLSTMWWGVMLVAAGLLCAFSPFSNTARTIDAAPQTPTLGGPSSSCSGAVIVTDLRNESASIGVRRITVNWRYNPPASCCIPGVLGFDVFIDVVRDSGNKKTNSFTTPGSQQELSMNVGNLGDHIKSVTARVMARLVPGHPEPGSRTVTVGQ